MMTENLTLQQLLTRKYMESFNRMMLIQPAGHIMSKRQAVELLDHLKLKTQNSSWLFQPVDIIHFQQQYAIVYEDFPGLTLQQYLIDSSPALHQVVQIAIELANACVSIHQQGEMIEHLSPNLIMIQPHTLKIKLLAPSTIKRTFAKYQQHVHTGNLDELSYIAPEQTGRVISEVDERTDLYALGAILYEMTTNIPLYNADNFVDYIFYILTKAPNTTLLNEQCKLVMLNKIILKLLSKNKEERYETAFGLRHDLMKAMQLLIHHEFDAQFTLGEQDTPYQPNFSTKLYGRETEQFILQKAYNNAKKGNKEIVFINGISGSGKSALAKSVMAYAAQDKGYFLEGKFDQLQEQYSFQPIIEPLRILLRQIFLEGEQSIDIFRSKMLEVELSITEGLLQLFPELEWLIDERFRIVQESKQYTLQLNAFIFASIEKLLHIFSLQKKTLVIFIDDIQWAELEAIQILEQIYEQHEKGFLLLIVANRIEAEKTDDLLLLWQKELAAFNLIQMRLLTPEAIFSIVSAALNSQCETAHIVAQRLFQMTQGNALFVHEVFRIFIKDKIIYYNFKNACWEYEVEKLQQNIGNTNLFNFIESRMNMLSEEALTVLQTASCFGHTFQFQLMLKLSNLPYYELLSNLEELIANGFIHTVDRQIDLKHKSLMEDSQQLYMTKFQFVHDRIQQAAYEMLSHDVRLNTHFAISRLLQQEDGIENPLQSLVRQLNYCKELLSLQEQKQLAIWNYELGIQAKNAGLYNHARQYFKQTFHFLPDHKWSSMREETVEIYMAIGECEYLVGNYEQSKNYIFEALSHARTKLEKLKIYRLISLIFIEEENTELVLNAGITAMELCNMNIKLEPKQWEVAKEFISLKLKLRNKTNEQLLNLKQIENEEIDVLIQIMINIVSNSFRMSQNLTGMILLRLMQLQLKYGAPTESAIVFINYALILISGSNDVKGALRFGKLAVSMAENQENTYIKSRVYFIYSIFLNHWEKDFDSSIHYMRNVQQNMEQLGMYYTISALSCFLCNAKLIDGSSIQDIEDELHNQQKLYGKYASALANDFLEEFKHWIHTLKTVDTVPEWDAHITLKNEEAVVMMHYTLRLRMAYLFKNEAQIKYLLQQLEKQSKEVLSLPTAPVYYFFRTLCNIDFLKGKMQHSFSTKTLLKEIQESITYFKKWASEAPHQYEHLYTLLLAEKLTLKQRIEEAAQLYDRAIQLSKIYRFTQDEAVFYERAGNVYSMQKDNVKAAYYITQAILTMRKWGAEAIAIDWENSYSQFISTRVETVSPILSYDMIRLFDATHTLANEEISTEEMLNKLLNSILKQANATSGYFIRYSNNNLYNLASINIHKQVFHFSSLCELNDQSIKVILDYVLQTDEPLVISNIETNQMFQHLNIQAKSVLCMPIKYKGKIQAFLFLENHLLVNAFNSVQLELLRIISTQIAVTLENTEIYNELENRVRERTATLDKMNLSLKDVNERLAINEQERKKLLHSISHELRSPLTSTLGYIESILDGVVQDETQQKYYLNRSKERLLSLNRLIQDLFELAKLEAGRMDFTFTRISIQQFFEEFAYRFEANVKEASLSYSTISRVSQEQYVVIDLLRIEQVISNLIANAIKYTEKGQIKLKVYVEADELICMIEDSGIGIPANELPFIFDSYFRASNTNALNSHGIGLAICKEIITQHHGKIFANSIKDTGSQFYFTLPLEN
ncbi:ATP-binding protein [Solibacillus silvestris]|uniref:ATP-binding protein n=1 Tax=Solibacillus silvestris TaxID=76853 RepID=UPI003F804672